MACLLPVSGVRVACLVLSDRPRCSWRIRLQRGLLVRSAGILQTRYMSHRQCFLSLLWASFLNLSLQALSAPLVLAFFCHGGLLGSFFPTLCTLYNASRHFRRVRVGALPQFKIFPRARCTRWRRTRPGRLTTIGVAGHCSNTQMLWRDTHTRGG